MQLNVLFIKSIKTIIKVNITASSDAGSKWKNIPKMYIVEDQELNNKTAKLSCLANNNRLNGDLNS